MTWCNTCNSIQDNFLENLVYRFDESGRISVQAEEKTGAVSAKTEIERQGALDDAKIDVLADLANNYRVE